MADHAKCKTKYEEDYRTHCQAVTDNMICAVGKPVGDTIVYSDTCGGRVVKIIYPSLDKKNGPVSVSQLGDKNVTHFLNH